MRRAMELQMWTFVLSACTAFLVLGGGHDVNAEASAEEENVNDIQIVYAKPFITAETSQFGEKIEGTSVDERGRIYAVNFQRSTSQLGRLSNEKGEVEQRLFFRCKDNTSDFNGIRFLPVPPSQRPTLASMAVVANKKGQVLQVLERRADGVVDDRVVCSDQNMIEPNDERHLYAAETWARDKMVYSNIVWKYDIDNATGRLSNRRLFFDMKDIDEELKGTAGDIDGMRTNMDGNPFLVRNGRPGEVVKVSVGGTVIRRIKVPGITDPTNVELSGPKGTTLFVVGKCTNDVQKGCIDVLKGNDAPGRAFHNLASQAGRHHDEL